MSGMKFEKEIFMKYLIEREASEATKKKYMTDVTTFYSYAAEAEEIDKELWQGKGKPNQLYGVIHHLRESLKGISSLVVEYRDEHYCLKMPHSIEKNTEKG